MLQLCLIYRAIRTMNSVSMSIFSIITCIFFPDLNKNANIHVQFFFLFACLVWGILWVVSFYLRVEVKRSKNANSLRIFSKRSLENKEKKKIIFRTKSNLFPWFCQVGFPRIVFLSAIFEIYPKMVDNLPTKHH